MPYPAEHSARVLSPIPSNASVTQRKLIAPGISIILQKSRGDDGALKTQSYRFNKNRFSPEQAKEWLKSHQIGFILFEPATGSQKETKKETRQEYVDRVSKDMKEI